MPIRAVVKNKYFSLIVEVEREQFRTMKASDCGGQAVIARLSDKIKRTCPISLDEIIGKMGGTGTPDEKRRAADRTLGEERGIYWASCGNLRPNSASMLRTYVNFFWKGPHPGDAILSRSTLAALIGRDTADRMINEYLGLPTKSSLVTKILDINPYFRSTSNFEHRINPIVLNSQAEEANLDTESVIGGAL